MDAIETFHLYTETKNHSQLNDKTAFKITLFDAVISKDVDQQR